VGFQAQAREDPGGLLRHLPGQEAGVVAHHRPFDASGEKGLAQARRQTGRAPKGEASGQFAHEAFGRGVELHALESTPW